MKKSVVIAVFAGVCFLLNGIAVGEEKSTDAIVSEHMVAEAMLTAHFIAAALKAGMSTDEINAVLAKVADETVISEFWISDEAGRIVFTNIPGPEFALSNLPGTAFAFPTDPDAGTQAAPFATLLSGADTVVVQGVQPRELDAAPFKYVGVAGVDQSRIVQVGLSGAEME